MSKPLEVKAGTKQKPKVINVWGKKDPRGWDNTIMIWVNEKNELVIQLEKPSPRCYAFDRIEDLGGIVQIIAKG